MKAENFSSPLSVPHSVPPSNLTDYCVQVCSPEHFLPEEGGGDARSQHGGGSDQRHSRHQSGQPRGREVDNNGYSLSTIEVLQTFQYQVQRTETTGCLPGQHFHTFQ